MNQLQEMAKLSSTQDATLFQTSELMAARMHPENPRDHDLEGDVQSIAASLLEVGWAQYLTIEKDGYLLSGHGRVMAADFLSKQSDEWFEHAWEKWLSKSVDRKALAHQHKPRFCPEFWLQCPAIVMELDEITQKSTMIRLNNQAKDGKDQPARLAALLSQMPREAQEHAGFDAATANAFVSAFVKKKKEAPPPEVEVDFQGKEYFSRPDATDYSGDVGQPGNAIAQSGEVDEYYEGEEDYDEEGEEPGDEEYLEASVDKDSGLVTVNADIEDYKLENVNYDSNIAETRVVLLCSNTTLDRYKAIVAPVAERLGIDTVSESVKVWRPKAVMAALEFVFSSLPGSPAVEGKKAATEEGE